jgi:hypothetical protein
MKSRAVDRARLPKALDAQRRERRQYEHDPDVLLWPLANGRRLVIKFLKSGERVDDR